jgi:hypothetical protein
MQMQDWELQPESELVANLKKEVHSEFNELRRKINEKFEKIERLLFEYYFPYKEFEERDLKIESEQTVKESDESGIA